MTVSAQGRDKYEFMRNLPVYADSLIADLTYPLAWGNSEIKDFDEWKKAARQKVFDCMLLPPPAPAEGYDVKVLFEETNPRYVEPCEPMIFTPKGDQFLWYSMRDGYKHLYLYNLDGTLVKQVTKGEYEVEGFIQFDKKGENIYIYANKDNLAGRGAYRVNIKKGTMTALTPAEGTHSVVIGEKTLVDVWASVNTPAQADMRDMNGKLIKTFYTSENPLKDYAMPDIKLGTIKAADGSTDLYYRLITPPNMEPGKKYPTLVYVYGGPHSQLVTDSWLGGGNLYFLFLAQQGYVVTKGC